VKKNIFRTQPIPALHHPFTNRPVMTKILYLFLALSFFMPARSQSRKTCDAVYINNGSIIRGKITVQNDTLVRILTECGSEFAFRKNAILRITTEKCITPKAAIARQGYMNFTSMGVLIGSTENQKSAPFSVLMEHTYRFDKTIALGGFLGFEQLNESVLPLGVYLKLFLPAGNSDLYLGTSAGYSFSLGKPVDPAIEKANGGFMFSTEIGVIIPVSVGSAISVAIGYRYNELHYELNNWYYGDYKQNNTYNRLMIRLGISIF
jgi:hypothetical protein